MDKTPVGKIKENVKRSLNLTLNGVEGFDISLTTDIVVANSLKTWFLEETQSRKVKDELRELTEVLNLLRIIIPLKEVLLTEKISQKELKDFNLSDEGYQIIAELSYIPNFEQLPLWEKYKIASNLLTLKKDWEKKKSATISKSVAEQN